MTQISNLTGSVDSRNNWQKVSRRQLWNGGKKLGVAIPVGAKHDEMVKIYQASGFTPEQVVNFVPVQVPDGDGTSTKTVMYPEHHERKENEQKDHRRMEEFERRIATATEAENKRMADEKAAMEKQKDSEINILKSELEDMKVMMAQILEKTKVETKPVETKPADLNTMHWKSFQKLAKTVDVEWSTKDPREPVIEKLEAQSG